MTVQPSYKIIGSVTNISARLCGEAKAGEILAERKMLARLEGVARTLDAGERSLKGFAETISAHRLLGLDAASNRGFSAAAGQCNIQEPAGKNAASTIIPHRIFSANR